MVTHAKPSDAPPGLIADMEFQLVVLQDASAQADRYWCNWLWARAQPSFGPSDELLHSLSGCHPIAIETAWRNWFKLLTSFEFAFVLTGRDLRAPLVDYGSCCRKQ